MKTTEPSGNSGTLPAKTGRLIDIGILNADCFSAFRYYECVDCGTRYPDARCNGKETGGLCPWCRPDSKPWTNGRGL